MLDSVSKLFVKKEPIEFMMLDVSKNDFTDAREIFDVLLKVHFVHSVDLSNSLTTVRDS